MTLDIETKAIYVLTDKTDSTDLVQQADSDLITGAHVVVGTISERISSYAK